MAAETKCIFLHVSPEEAKRFEDLKGINQDSKALEEYFKGKQYNFECDMESLDEDLIQYKARVIIWSKALQDARDETYEKSERLWDNFSQKMSPFKGKVESLVKEFKPLEEAITGIDNKLNSLNEWKIDKFISLIERVANLTDSEKKLMMFVMDHQDELNDIAK